MGLTRIRAEQISDIDYKQAVRAIQTTNVTLAGGAPSQVDGVNLMPNDRVLVTGQNTGSENGLYYVATLGTGSNGTWARTFDANQTGEIEAGMIVMVTEGSTYADTQWKLTTNDPIVIGTTALTFVLNAVSIIGGSTTQVQYNSGGVLAGSSNLTFDGTSLTVGGNITSGNIFPAANITYDLGSSNQRWNDLWLSNSTIYLGSAQISANSTALVLTNPGGGTTVLAGATPDVQSSTVSASGNITGGNLLTGGLISATGNITAGNISATNHTGTIVSVTGTITGASVVGGIMTGTSLSVTGNVDAGNLRIGGLVSATGNISGNYFLGNGSQLTGITVAAGGSNTQIQFNDDNAIAGSAAFTFDKSTNVIATTGTFSATGNITGGNIIAAGTVKGANIDSSNADLAERYLSDKDYPPGTVVVFGGNQEITQSLTYADPRIAGVISTTPAYRMNTDADGQYVALQGRVPCRVVGKISKGDLVTSSDQLGVATRLDPVDWHPGCVIGKALEAYDNPAEGMIEVVVGRL